MIFLTGNPWPRPEFKKLYPQHMFLIAEGLSPNPAEPEDRACVNVEPLNLAGKEGLQAGRRTFDAVTPPSF